MSSREGPQTAFACDLGALTDEQADSAQGTPREAGTGHDAADRRTEAYAFAYAADIAPTAIAEWVDFERHCPFLRFTIESPEDTGPLRLHVCGRQA